LELYFRPVNRFVASFIGSPTMNFIPARVEGSDQNLTVRAEGVNLPIPLLKIPALTPYRNREVLMGLRPDDLPAGGYQEEKETIKAWVLVVQPVGNQIFLDVKVGSHNVLAAVDAQTEIKPHQEIFLKPNLKNLHFFDPETEQAILG
jgi:multiple sugar transport system ATP-binding protein